MSPAEIENTLRAHLKKLLPHHWVRDVYEYATLPGGKLFRPNLVWSILKDINPDLYLRSFNKSYSDHALLASSVEFHHCYTLIHDDLPCMDDDTERRGKPCTHIKYGQWQALLSGDGLLNISYQLLSKTNAPRSLEVIRFFSWALGPKGLIHGQVMDLSHEMTANFQSTLRTHELKTARLIQVAILASACLASDKNLQREKKLWKYSKLLGINFQLLDDLSELTAVDLSQHERDVNPWLHHCHECFSATMKSLQNFNHVSDQLKLTETNKIICEYYKKMLKDILDNQEIIENHLEKKISLLPIISLIENFSET